MPPVPPVRNRDQHAGVQYILDSVVAQLAAVPSRRFVYAEVAFLARWWRQQDEATRRLVRELVQEGTEQLGGTKRGMGGTGRDWGAVKRTRGTGRDWGGDKKGYG